MGLNTTKVLNGTQTAPAPFATALMEHPNVPLCAASPPTAYTPLKPLVRPGSDCVRVVFTDGLWCHHTASLLPSGSCCASCESCTYNHRIYANGQRFSTPDQPCQVCACQVNMSLFKQTRHTPAHFQTHNTAFSSPQYGSVACERSPCPPLNCSNSYTPPGDCCPKCPGNESCWKWTCSSLAFIVLPCFSKIASSKTVFLWTERLFQTHWMRARNAGVWAARLNAGKRSVPVLTATLLCPGSAVKTTVTVRKSALSVQNLDTFNQFLKPYTFASGCNYAGKEYPNGQDFPHPTDSCRTCSCIVKTMTFKT